MFPIIHEDGELLVINKPAGLVCHPTKGDAFSSLIGRVRLHLGESSPAHIINRLDRETSGIVVIARSDAGARELRQAWESRLVRKEYLAIVHGHPEWDSRVADFPLGKDLSSEVAIKDCVRPDGSPSLTEFRVQRRFYRGGKPFALVDAFPHTGRKHQIRIHLAHLGHPIVGDKMYGGNELIYLSFVKGLLAAGDWDNLLLPNQALHAARLSFPWRGGSLTFEAPPESDFARFLESGEPVPP